MSAAALKPSSEITSQPNPATNAPQASKVKKTSEKVQSLAQEHPFSLATITKVGNLVNEPPSLHPINKKEESTNHKTGLVFRFNPVTAAASAANSATVSAEQNDAQNKEKTSGDFASLLAAVNSGERADCEALLKKGINIEATDSNGRNILHHAALKGNLDIVQLFAANKTLLEAKDKYGHTPLLWTALNGEQTACEILLMMEADATATNADKKNALHLAGIAGRAEVVQLFATDKRLLEAKDAQGFTPLLSAAYFGHRKACEILRAAGANVKATDSNGQNVLHLAVATGRREVVELFAVNKLLLESKDHEGSTPLLLAANHGKAVCEILLKAGANLEVPDSKGNTVLHIAAFNGKTDIVQLFAANKGLLEAKNKQGLTPLFLAAYSGHRATCEILLKAGANVECTNSNGRNVLHIAVFNGKTETVQLFAANKGLLEATDKQGLTPLFLAAHSGHRAACE
ncbi:MAG TPA: ankyrin repeat domain-containing protein, partial [Chlamydiales bacterium]